MSYNENCAVIGREKQNIIKLINFQQNRVKKSVISIRCVYIALASRITSFGFRICETFFPSSNVYEPQQLLGKERVFNIRVTGAKITCVRN